MSPAAREVEVLVVGTGAIGSRFGGAAPGRAVLTFCDPQLVDAENLGVAAFGEADLGRAKAEVVAARRRARGALGRALVGEVRYALRPGLAERLDAAVIAVDDPLAVRDATEVLWSAGPAGRPVLILGCGGPEGGHQARLFTTGGPCALCLWSEEERARHRALPGASCARSTAPRASAAAARGAAEAGAAMLGSWLDGDRSLENHRVQRDPGSPADRVVRMPSAPSPGCPMPHGRAPIEPIEMLPGSIAKVSLATLAERALARAGEDAEIALGRRFVPLGGAYCVACRAISPAPPLLLPAALAQPGGCGCGATRRPFGARSTIGARELLARTLASLTLADFGAGHGEEIVAAGSRGRVRLRCTFDWKDLDDA